MSDSTITPELVESLATWSEAKEVQTKHGPRLLRKAEVTDRFWVEWRLAKAMLKALGVGVSKNADDKWELAWWQELPAEVKAKRAQSVADSKAAAASIELVRPEGLNYMPFQIAGIRYALARPNVLIADEMGLGKTIQAIGIVNNDPEIDSVLVVCPKSLKLNWLREFEKWQTRGFQIGVINAKGNGNNWVSTEVVIINYEQLPKHKAAINAREWGALIIDEAHLIKSSKTQRSQMIKGKGRSEVTGYRQSQWVWDVEPIRARRHIRLTGTPIVNRPVDLYNLIEDMEPSFGKFFTFAKRYAGAHQNGYGWDFGGASNLDELQRRLRETIMVRRMKADVLTELPAKIRQVIPVEADDPLMRDALAHELTAEYNRDQELADLRAAVELSKAESDEAYKAAVERLTNASRLAFEEIAELRHRTAVAKLPAVIDHVRGMLEDGTDKVIIAAHHHDVIDSLVDGLKAFKPVSITGRDNETKRLAAVDAFQNDPSVRVFVASIMAAGVGITLTAASTVVFAELDWVPGNVSQMEDRAHRIGQTNTVLVQHLVLDGSIDARIAQVLIGKQQVIDAALDKDHPERSAPVYVPRETAATQSTSRKAIDTMADKLTPEQIAAIHAALRMLAGHDGDFATDRNGVGFNKVDGMIGHNLAACASLTPRQAALGYRVVLKYHAQIGDELVAAIKGKVSDAD